MRVQLRLDITKPIPRSRLVTFSAVRQMWVSFKYERLPWLCFGCGIIGHLERDCGSLPGNGSGSSRGIQQYGPWFQASDPSSRRRGYGRAVLERSKSGGPSGGGGASLNFKINRQLNNLGAGASSFHGNRQNVAEATISSQGISRMDMDKTSGLEPLLSDARDVEQVKDVPPTVLSSNDQLPPNLHGHVGGDLHDNRVVGSDIHEAYVMPIFPQEQTHVSNISLGGWITLGS